MSQQPPDNQLLDLIGKLIPVGTFFIGLMLGSLRDWWSRRRELRNIRLILSNELDHIYSRLSLPNPRELILPRPQYAKIDSLATILSELSTPVYEAYLDRLAALKPEEISELLIVQYLTKAAIKDAREYMVIRREVPFNPSAQRQADDKATNLLRLWSLLLVRIPQLRSALERRSINKADKTLLQRLIQRIPHLRSILERLHIDISPKNQP